MKIETTRNTNQHNESFFTTTNVLRETENSANRISVSVKIREPYYEKVTGGLSAEEIAKLTICGYFDCSRSVDSYFAFAVSEWVDDTSIVPFGSVVDSEGKKFYYWGNSDVVFWATSEQLLRTKTEVEECGYNGQLSCFPWAVIAQMQSEQFRAFRSALKSSTRKAMLKTELPTRRRRTA